MRSGPFYELNGYDLDAPFDEVYDLVVGVADGSARDVPKIAALLAQWRHPVE